MGKTLRYGEFKFGKGGSTSAPSKGGDGRRLVQFYAGGGKVKKAVPAGLGGGQEQRKASPAPKAPPMAKGAPAGALSAMRAPSAPMGMPNLSARARIPGGMAKGGAAHKDVTADKAMVKGAVHKHERAMHPGKPVTKLARGGVPSHSRKPMYGGGKC
jgi:hypothetical protein